MLRPTAASAAARFPGHLGTIQALTAAEKVKTRVAESISSGLRYVCCAQMLNTLVVLVLIRWQLSKLAACNFDSFSSSLKGSRRAEHIFVIYARTFKSRLSLIRGFADDFVAKTVVASWFKLWCRV